MVTHSRGSIIAGVGPQAGLVTRTPLPGGLHLFRPPVSGVEDAPPLQAAGRGAQHQAFWKTKRERDDRCTYGIARDRCTAGGTRVANDYAGVDQRGDRNGHSRARRTPTTGGFRDATAWGNNCFSPPTKDVGRGGPLQVTGLHHDHVHGRGTNRLRHIVGVRTGTRGGELATTRKRRYPWLVF